MKLKKNLVIINMNELTELGLDASDKGAKKRAEELKVNSQEELMSIFLQNSVGIYVKQKNNEHIGSASNEEVKDWVKEDLGNLLKGLQSQYVGKDEEEMKELVTMLQKNLDIYVDKMDHTLSAARDKELGELVNTNDSIKKDEALIKAANSNEFNKVSKDLLNNPKGFWQIAGNVFENLGIKSIAKLCQKRHLKLQLMEINNTMDKVRSDSKIETNKQPNQLQTKGRDSRTNFI